jgi:beta-lactamase superfamily II metal-dependent hydrolase
MVSKALISCLVAFSLFISVLAPSAFAQQMVFDDWTAVQALTPGDEIVISLKTNEEVKGKFLDAGADEVSIERKGKRESVAKDTIAQLHLVKGKAAKGKWA